MQARVGLIAAMVALTAGLSGCTAPRSTCLVGYSAAFDLTVLDESTPGLSVRFCDDEQCSPVPQAGPVPAYLTDRANDHGAFLRHLSRGEWNIRPGGLNDSAPSTAQIGLYRNGVLETTSTIHIEWPDVDPCAATFPPQPHFTIRAG